MPLKYTRLALILLAGNRCFFPIDFFFRFIKLFHQYFCEVSKFQIHSGFTLENSTSISIHFKLFIDD